MTERGRHASRRTSAAPGSDRTTAAPESRRTIAALGSGWAFAASPATAVVTVACLLSVRSGRPAESVTGTEAGICDGPALPVQTSPTTADAGSAADAGPAAQATAQAGAVAGAVAGAQAGAAAQAGAMAGPHLSQGLRPGQSRETSPARQLLLRRASITTPIVTPRGQQPHPPPQHPPPAGGDGIEGIEGTEPPRPVKATVERSFTVSAWPWGHVAGAEASAIGRFSSKVSPHARHRKSYRGIRTG